MVLSLKTLWCFRELLNFDPCRPTNIVRVTENDSFVDSIYIIQLHEQQGMFKKTIDVFLLDATYNTNYANMALYTLLVTDNYGYIKGLSVAYYFVC